MNFSSFGPRFKLRFELSRNFELTRFCYIYIYVAYVFFRDSKGFLEL
jgi:hypothetical protein